ncbi:MAG: DUF2964 family protein, partial [Burkholderia sp.]|nr:DUF2964 family protein [Burkholderia sp.]
VHAMLVEARVLPYAVVTLVSGAVAFVAQLNAGNGERS